MSAPRILVAGLRGGSGKTVVALGLTAAWRQQGHVLAPFKKGPDYIDAAWLALAGQRLCRNLDLYLMPPRVITRSFLTGCAGADVAVIEGNRGLFDGLDAGGSCSTAELAKLLQAPVLLVVDCTKTTRTVAALVLGCQRLDPEVDIRGVVLNRVAGERHEAVARAAVEQDCGLPVLGAIPRLSRQSFPERHLGLVPPQEHEQGPEAVARAAHAAEEYLDLDAIHDAARAAPPIEADESACVTVESPAARPVRVGVFRDAAFQFYYPENLEALAAAGARLVEISPLSAAGLPEVDGLYIGGGFPETLAQALSANAAFRDALRRQIKNGLPVYAECGGLVYLGERLLVGTEQYEMTGVLPVDFVLHARPQGHGYAELETIGDNPFFSVGECPRGHEFHYTGLRTAPAAELRFAFRVRRGHGFDGHRDGLCRYNVLASYTHVHALGVESWAPSVVRAARRYAHHGPEGAQP